MRALRYIAPLALLSLFSCVGESNQSLVINDKDYFEEQGVSVLVYGNNAYGGFNDEKNTAIEVIQHGVRTIQGGTVRLNRTPEQWDLLPTPVNFNVDRESNTITTDMRYEEYDFDFTLEVTGKGKAVEISVILDKPVPERLVGEAGFNLEFVPSQFWSKSYTVDGKTERFPKYAVSDTEVRPNEQKAVQFKGFKTYDDRGTGMFVDPLPLASGHNYLIAPESPERMIKVSCDDALIDLYDGRMVAQNGWFTFRSLLPAGKTGKVLTWTVEPNAVPGWIREPNIGFSQVGYVPAQPKTAVIEIDPNDVPLKSAKVMRIMEDGLDEVAYSGKVIEWGKYFKYDYLQFDFTELNTPGLYYIKYGNTRTENFIIGDDVFDKITDATTDVWVPIHMNHMAVNEGYRMWHGEPFKEGYYQAPVTDHFDNHYQDDLNDTKYKPHQLIPGLNVGGFFDAGDFDMETGSTSTVVTNLVRAWELFRSERDETFVSKEQRYVDLHRPDGTPDILQYIEHGVSNLVAQAESIGYMALTLSNSVLDNYHHLGDAASITDGLRYDPSLKPYQVSADGKRSGTPDDMWAFTTRHPVLDLRSAATMAAASRALKGYNDDLSSRALAQAKRLVAESEAKAIAFKMGRPFAGQHDELSTHGYPDIPANIQLYAATGEEKYKAAFEARIWDALENSVSMALQPALDAIPYMDEAYKEKLRPYVEKYQGYIDTLENDNPYGVPIGLGTWAGSIAIADFGTAVCFANKYYPGIIPLDNAYKAANWLFGCHPYHNYSLVAAVGANRPKNLFYGNNRADFAAIPGNVAPGMLLHRPDHFENYDDWPFFWAENEGTIVGNTAYIIFGSAFKALVKGN